MIEKRKYADIPFSPGKIPFFYGWIIIAVGIIGVLMSIPGQTMGVSVFTDDLIRVLGLSRVNLSLAYMIGTITSAVLLTPAGKRLDKYGARNMGTVVIALLGVLLILMSNIDDALNTIINILPGFRYAGAFILITISFFLLRFLGQGLLSMISRNMVMIWFDRYRGMANAILGVFTSFGFSLAPRVLNGFIENSGWDGAWRSIGFIFLVVCAAVFWLISRDSPDKCGLKADGNIKLVSKKNRPVGKPKKDFTLKQARRTLPFWAFGLTLAMQSLFITAFTFHIVSIFESAGMTRTEAVAIFLPASLISVGINFTVSMMSDYIKLRYILMAQAAGILITMISLANLSSGLPLLTFIIGYGIIGGLFNISITIVWPRYYGTKHLGEITGMIMGFVVAGSALGPYFFSIVRKLSGSYTFASYICFAVMIPLAFLAFRVRRPEHPDFKESC